MARILVIDDRAAIRQLISTVLGADGHQVSTADSGEQGVPMYQKVQPDIVIIDIFMPGRDGIQTIRDLRAVAPAVKILAMSAGWSTGAASQYIGDDYDVLEDAKRAGADHALRKPFDVSVLREAVRTLTAK
jgi:two-component system, chemotaxis family, chemotaxis protein CheY